MFRHQFLRYYGRNLIDPSALCLRHAAQDDNKDLMHRQQVFEDDVGHI